MKKYLNFYFSIKFDKFCLIFAKAYFIRLIEFDVKTVNICKFV